MATLADLQTQVSTLSLKQDALRSKIAALKAELAKNPPMLGMETAAQRAMQADLNQATNDLQAAQQQVTLLQPEIQRQQALEAQQKLAAEQAAAKAAAQQQAAATPAGQLEQLRNDYSAGKLSYADFAAKEKALLDVINPPKPAATTAPAFNPNVTGVGNPTVSTPTTSTATPAFNPNVGAVGNPTVQTLTTAPQAATGPIAGSLAWMDQQNAALRDASIAQNQAAVQNNLAYQQALDEQHDELLGLAKSEAEKRIKEQFGVDIVLSNDLGQRALQLEQLRKDLADKSNAELAKQNAFDKELVSTDLVRQEALNNLYGQNPSQQAVAFTGGPGSTDPNSYAPVASQAAVDAYNSKLSGINQTYQDQLAALQQKYAGDPTIAGHVTDELAKQTSSVQDIQKANEQQAAVEAQARAQQVADAQGMAQGVQGGLDRVAKSYKSVYGMTPTQALLLAALAGYAQYGMSGGFSGAEGLGAEGGDLGASAAGETTAGTPGIDWANTYANSGQTMTDFAYDVPANAGWEEALGSGWEGAVADSSVQNMAIAELTGQVPAGTLASAIGEEGAAAALASAGSLGVGGAGATAAELAGNSSWEDALGSSWENAVGESSLQNVAIAEAAGQVPAGTLASAIGEDAAAGYLATAGEIVAGGYAGAGLSLSDLNKVRQAINLLTGSGGAGTPTPRPGAGNNMASNTTTGGSLYDLLPGILSGYNYFDAMSSASENRDKMVQAMQNAAAAVTALTPPDLAAALQPYQKAVFLGQITPEDYVAIMQQQSAMAGVQVDPALVQQQKAALDKLNEVATQGGLTAQDRARLKDIADSENLRARGAREAATSNAAARGVAGSGYEMLQRNMADQAAVQSASKRGTDVAALAQQRALDAMMQSGQLAGQMRTQQFSEDSKKAEAQDAINKFNAQVANDAARINTQARNAAAMQARQDEYNVQTQNLNQANREQEARMKALQDAYTNQYNKEKSVSDIGVQTGKMYGDLAKADKEAAAKYATGLGQVLGSNTTKDAVTGVLGSVFGNGAGGASGGQSSGGGILDQVIGGLGNIFGGGSTTPDPSTLPGPGGGDWGGGWEDIDWSSIGDLFSDKRLKKNVEEISTDEICSILDDLVPSKFKYKDEKHGEGDHYGIMAQDLAKGDGNVLIVEKPEGLAIDGKKAQSFALAALASLNDRLKKVESK